MVLPEAPFPLRGGGQFRTASLLSYLAKRYAVDAIVFREPGAADPAELFPPGLVRRMDVLPLPRHSRGTAARAARNAGRLLRGVPPLVDRFSGYERQMERLLAGRHYEVALVEHFWCARYWNVVAPRSATTVLDLHNIESVLLERYAETTRGPARAAYQRFCEVCRGLEKEWLPRFSRLLVTSPVDANAARQLSPDCTLTVYPNAIPLVPPPPRREGNAIVFTGNLRYQPNIQAVRYFAREIWPGLSRKWPGLVWRIVGREPEEVRKIVAGDSRVELTGPVEDAIDELARAKVAVVPVLAGSGTRLKIIEAWAAVAPVVSTSLGAEGLPARHAENILLADTPAGFADAASALLAKPELRHHVGCAGRREYEKAFTWEQAWRQLAMIL